ncbi:MAG: MFS transporter [Thermomicrobiales bacterium]|nr:MFS transporter [Thermomicrobiales bacterium]
MSAPGNPIDRVSVYVAAGLVSGCGALMFNVMPVFVGAMADSLGYNEAQLGDIVAIFNVGFTVSALSALLWVRVFDWRLLGLIGVLISTISLVSMPMVDDGIMRAVLMGSTGLGMGGLYALVLAVLGDSRSPDRAFGIKLGIETVPGALLLYLLPALIVPIYGFFGTSIAMAIVVLALGIAAWFLPRSGLKSVTRKRSAADPLSIRAVCLPVVGLLSSLLFFTGIAATWTFLELLAQTRSLPADAVGTALGISFLICGLGGFAAAVIGDRAGPVPPMLGIVGINLAGLWFLSAFQTTTGYAVGACLFLFSVNFTLAYTFGLTAQVDDRGRLVALSAACLSIGAIVGPAIAGRLITASGYGAMLSSSAVCSVASLLVYLTLIHLQRTHAPSAKPLPVHPQDLLN